MQLQTLSIECKRAKKAAEAGRTGAVKDNTARIAWIKKHKKELVTAIARLEAEAVSRSKAIAADGVKGFQTVVESANDILTSAESLRVELEKLPKRSEQKWNVDFSIRRANHRLVSLQTKFRGGPATLPSSRFFFKPNHGLTERLLADRSFGYFTSVVNVTTPWLPPIRRIHPTPTPLEATHVSSISVRLPSDEEKCYITACVILPNGKLVLNDFQNRKVKLVDVNVSKLTSVLALTEGPWDATRVTNTLVAVTVPYNSEICLVSVSGVLKLDMVIKVRGEARGIDYINGKFVVSYDDPEKLEILDGQGRVYRTIQLHTLDRFKSPYFLKLDRTGNAVYLSDRLARTITRLTLEGTLTSGCSAAYPFVPGNLCLDAKGNVLCCSKERREIVMLAEDLSTVQVVACKYDGLDAAPLSVALCPETGRMYVGCGGDTVHVYQLTERAVYMQLPSNGYIDDYVTEYTVF